MEKKLAKSLTDKRIFGVCGGLAKYFGIDSNALRIAVVLLMVFYGFGLLAYLVAALIMPTETTE